MNGLTLHCPNVEPDSRYVRSILHFDPAWICRGLSETAKSILLDPFETLRNHRMTLTGRTGKNSKGCWPIYTACRPPRPAFAKSG